MKDTGSFKALLAKILSGQGEADREPHKERSAGESLVAHIESPVLRGLFSANLTLAARHQALRSEHQQAHQDGTKPHNCREVNRELSRLGDQAGRLGDLFWLGVQDTIPGADLSKVGMRKGWEVIRTPDSEENSFRFPPSHPRTALFTKLTGILQNSSAVETDIPEPGLPEIDLGVETPIGRVEDPIARQLVLVEMGLMMATKELFPGCDPANPDFEGLVSLRLAGDPKLEVQTDELRYASKLVDSLFWCLIRDIMPAINGHPVTGLRRNWQVVSVKPELGQFGEAVVIELPPGLVARLLGSQSQAGKG